jgi:hypothetical protein
VHPLDPHSAIVLFPVPHSERFYAAHIELGLLCAFASAPPRRDTARKIGQSEKLD